MCHSWSNWKKVVIECAPRVQGAYRAQGAYPAVDLAGLIGWAEHDEKAKGNPIGWKFWFNSGLFWSACLKGQLWQGPYAS